MEGLLGISESSNGLPSNFLWARSANSTRGLPHYAGVPINPSQQYCARCPSLTRFPFLLFPKICGRNRPEWQDSLIGLRALAWPRSWIDGSEGATSLAAISEGKVWVIVLVKREVRGGFCGSSGQQSWWTGSRDGVQIIIAVPQDPTWQVDDFSRLENSPQNNHHKRIFSIVLGGVGLGKGQSGCQLHRSQWRNSLRHTKEVNFNVGRSRKKLGKQFEGDGPLVGNCGGRRPAPLFHFPLFPSVPQFRLLSEFLR
ncbi:hypothetical protein Ddc_16791 [Ditylenchus destructor]|nr:hypothetical protein Ddc_16791 [Ditylenchus destructor]